MITPRPCEKEPEVVEAARSGRLDTRWGDELRAHMACCEQCADAALVARFLQDQSEAALAGVQVPTAAFVWWKAQLRARREAAEKALRPIAIAERVGFAAALFTVFVALGWVWPSLRSLLGQAGSFASLPGYELPASVPAFLILHWELALGTGLAVAAGLAFLVYAVVEK